ncbi:hypothetical protein LTS08_001887 [Lithohypha guttulata]|uniref:uncharacterized protein n=1 Tax=Lithohypha guttulata TaxID=1690604 RepID=UPI002DE12B7A|nr:hypothetical protein LTR51_003429 [Lithohypha guttulata]KAK5105610.1 hypothetical protein LTS08_001887 [Lithohypha guttulata]
MSGSNQTQRNTLETFIQGWRGWTPEGMMATFSDDCTQSALPFTMHQPQRNMQDIKAALPKLIRVVDNYELKIHNIVHDTTNGKAAIYAISKGDTPFGDWNMEYAVFVEFNEDGDKIVKLEEMLDSGFMREFAPKFGSFLMENPDW